MNNFTEKKKTKKPKKEKLSRFFEHQSKISNDTNQNRNEDNRQNSKFQITKTIAPQHLHGRSNRRVINRVGLNLKQIENFSGKSKRRNKGGDI